MTEQQIDRDQLRAVADHAEQANSAVYLAPRSLRSLLDQADQAEAELESWMTRAYEAEKRAWRAEARIKAVRAILDHSTVEVDGWVSLLVSADDIRAALDGDA